MGFKIRKIFDDLVPANRTVMEQILDLTQSHIVDIDEEYLASMRTLFRNPVHRKMRHIFFAASDLHGRLKAFALLSYDREFNFSFLDLIVTDSDNRSGGVGSSLYERVRQEAILLKSSGLFLECLTDDPREEGDRSLLRANRARLRFYEKYQALPVDCPAFLENTRKVYGQPYFLICDRLDRETTLTGSDLRGIVGAILEKKRTPPCARKTVQAVTGTIPDGPVSLRSPRYTPQPVAGPAAEQPISEDMKIVLIYNRDHIIHHIKEQGYAESPVRVSRILEEIEKTDLFRKVPFRKYRDSWITAVHDRDFVTFFKQVTQALGPEETIYPDVFPIRKEVSPPKALISRAGYYCIDVYSPINRNAYLAARAAVDCALTAADELLKGNHIVYSLNRPPGHHADSKSFGGFCYFNSTAIAANYLSGYGKVAILDVDYHHGNGQEEIFYERADVLTVSLHGDPDYEYPHFTGFKRDTGYGDGLGFNINYPLPRGTDGPAYHKTLQKALGQIKKFGPHFLIIAFGMDTAKGDPTGTWLLESRDFRKNGELIGSLGLPTLVIQEGGYNNNVLGVNAREFFSGLWEEQYR